MLLMLFGGGVVDGVAAVAVAGAGAGAGAGGGGGGGGVSTHLYFAECSRTDRPESFRGFGGILQSTDDDDDDDD